MECEHKKEYTKNQQKLNENVNNDEYDPLLGDYESDYYQENFKDCDMIGDYQDNIIISNNQRNLQQMVIVKINYNNPSKINDFDSDSQTYESLFEVQQQILEDEQNWKIKKLNQSEYRVFQREQKKKTEQFD